MFVALYSYLFHFFVKRFKSLKISPNRRFSLNISDFLTISVDLGEMVWETGLLRLGRSNSNPGITVAHSNNQIRSSSIHAGFQAQTKGIGLVRRKTIGWTGDGDELML